MTGEDYRKRKRQQIYERLSEIRGVVIRESIEIEELLGSRLLDYFYPKNCRQKTDLYWKVINTRNMSFNEKIKLFESIEYFKKRKYYREVDGALREIQKLRNILAHWHIIVSESTPERIVMKSPIDIKAFILDKSILPKFEEQNKLLIKRLMRVNAQTLQYLLDH